MVKPYLPLAGIMVVHCPLLVLKGICWSFFFFFFFPGLLSSSRRRRVETKPVAAGIYGSFLWIFFTQLLPLHRSGQTGAFEKMSRDEPPVFREAPGCRFAGSRLVSKSMSLHPPKWPGLSFEASTSAKKYSHKYLHILSPHQKSTTSSRALPLSSRQLAPALRQQSLPGSLVLVGSSDEASLKGPQFRK